MDTLIRGQMIRYDDRPLEYILAEVSNIPFLLEFSFSARNKQFYIRWGKGHICSATLTERKTLVILPQDAFVILNEEEVVKLCVLASAVSVDNVSSGPIVKSTRCGALSPTDG